MKKQIAILSLFLTYTLHGQDLIFKNYTLEDGFPSSEAHDSYQDAHGYMWFATDRGLARFDGEDFQVINSQNGLPEDCVFNFFEQSPTHVWIATKSNQLYWFNPLARHYHFLPYTKNDSLKVAFQELKRVKGFTEYIRQCWLDKDKNLIVSFLTGTGFIKLTKEGSWSIENRISHFLHTTLFSDLLIHFCIDSADSYAFSEFVPKKTSGSNDRKIYLKNVLSKDTIDTGLNYKNIMRADLVSVVDFFYSNGKLILLQGSNCFILSNDGFRNVSLSTEGLKIVQTGKEYLVTTLKGCHRFDNNWNLKESYLVNNTVTSCLVDKAEGVWLTTLEDGIFYAKSSRIHTYQTGENIKNNPKSIIVNRNWVACYTEDKTLNIFSRDGTTLRRFEKIFAYLDDYGTYNKDIVEDLEQYLGPHFVFSIRPDVYHFFPGHHGSTHFAGFSKSAAEKSYGPNIDSLYASVPIANDFCFTSDSTAFFATDTGLCVYEKFKDSCYQFGPAAKYKSKIITALAPFRKGLVMLVHPHKVAYLNLKDSSAIELPETYRILSELHIARALNDSIIWLASSDGLIRMSIKGDFENVELNKVSVDEGLINNEILSLELFNDTVWVGTKRGICFFPDDESIDDYEEIPSFFNMDSILINTNYICQTTDTLEVNYGDEIDFYFKQISFSENDNMRYRYWFSSGNGSWSVTNIGQIHDLSRVPGYSELIIQPVCSHCKSSEIRLVIYTSYPFWYQWWFYVSILLGLSVIIWLVSKFIAHRRTIKKEKQIDKLKLEMRSLLSQMNPHFMFNTINAIQHYIVNHSAKDAVLYLADFALLIRRTLEYSRSEFITLEEELEFLKLYAELENKRFASGFQIHFEVELRSLAREIRFPSLLLQPLVENAIIHGISTRKKGEGLITVTIQETEHYFNISVLDNGDGFSPKKHTFERKSLGMDILKNRVRLYNGSRFAETDIQFTDRNSGNKRGTEVKLILYKQQHESADY